MAHTKEEQALLEEANTAFVPLDDYVRELREKLCKTEEDPKQLYHFSVCVRLILHDYTLKDLKHVPSELADYVVREKKMLKGVLKLYLECKRAQKDATARLKILLHDRKPK